MGFSPFKVKKRGKKFALLIFLRYPSVVAMVLFQSSENAFIENTVNARGESSLRESTFSFVNSRLVYSIISFKFIVPVLRKCLENTGNVI